MLWYKPAFSLMAVDRIFSQGVITPRSITLKQMTNWTLWVTFFYVKLLSILWECDLIRLSSPHLNDFILYNLDVKFVFSRITMPKKMFYRIDKVHSLPDTERMIIKIWWNFILHFDRRYLWGIVCIVSIGKSAIHRPSVLWDGNTIKTIPEPRRIGKYKNH